MNQNILFSDGPEEIFRFDTELLTEGRLEVIVKYNGDIGYLNNIFESVEILSPQYAIITGTPTQLRQLYTYNNIEYIELPKTLTYELSSSRYSVCATRAQSQPYNLTGNGTVIGIIDSGIDFTHPDFRNEDGTSRILYIWDQTGIGPSPTGFRNGTEYSREEINFALNQPDPINYLGFNDTAGHGTAVAGIAAGNGRASNGREKGIAPLADLIIVKLGRRGEGAFPRSTEIMRGIKYTIDRATELGLPLSINLSYGTNNGSHSGDSLFEQYINESADLWKTVISVASGNEGSAGHHFSASLSQGETLSIPISVSGGSQKLYIALWKNFSDDFSFILTSPQNISSPQIIPTQRIHVFNLSGTDITVFYGQPSNYSTQQEVFFLFENDTGPISQGIWILTVSANIVVDGRFDMWLPTLEDVSAETSFSRADPNTTLTLPSTVQNVITVGGYNANTNTFSIFSGRGYTRNNVYIKPDLTAPAENILTTRSGGGYMQFSGTSFAAPFVTGAAALLMEWGIVHGNDIFLYGQRVKAFLQKGAKRTLNIEYPNNIWGYGTLCISGALDLLSQYN